MLSDMTPRFAIGVDRRGGASVRVRVLLGLAFGMPFLQGAEPHHDEADARPRIRSAAGDFRPRQDPLPVQPPAGAMLLFGDGTEGPPRFTALDGGPLDWPVEDGTLVVGATGDRGNHAVSRETFRDADIHVEFLTSPVAGGNSGLYVHGNYELQIADSLGVESPTEHDEGSLYGFAAPLVNAARPTGEWQVYDVRFVAPRRGADGTIVTPGRITAWLNGRLVLDGVEFTEPRSPYRPSVRHPTDHIRGMERRLLETGWGPLILQDHDSPTRFRNVWIRRLE